MKRCLLLLVLLCSACGDSRKNSPQQITADGEFRFACKDYVWIDNEGGGLLGGGETTFRVKYSDKSGTSHVLKGIHKLEVAELPEGTPLCR